MLVGFGAPDLDERCIGVSCRQAWPASLREVTSGEAVGFADVRYNGLVLPSAGEIARSRLRSARGASSADGISLFSSHPWRDFFAVLVKAFCAMVLS